MTHRPVLTPYDEFPVHQAPVPFSQVSSTDLGWDDGYFFCAFNAAEKVILFTGMRVSPNSDMIGGYAGISIEGRQYTVRFSREWRPDFATRIGPLSYTFTRPLREIALRLDASDFDLSFDLVWEAVAEPWVEALYGDECHGHFPPLLFLQLLFGYRSLDELYAYFQDIWPKDEARLLLNTLFPKQPSWVQEMCSI